MTRLRKWLGFSMALLAIPALHAEDWPQLPWHNAAVELPAQEWPLRPGPRTIKVLVHYPEGRLDRVAAETGLMLTLHNWGGVDCVGALLLSPGDGGVVQSCGLFLQS